MLEKYNPDFVEMIKRNIKSVAYGKHIKGTNFLQIKEQGLEKIAIKTAIEIEKYMTTPLKEA